MSKNHPRRDRPTIQPSMTIAPDSLPSGDHVQPTHALATSGPAREVESAEMPKMGKGEIFWFVLGLAAGCVASIVVVVALVSLGVFHATSNQTPIASANPTAPPAAPASAPTNPQSPANAGANPALTPQPGVGYVSGPMAVGPVEVRLKVNRPGGPTCLAIRNITPNPLTNVSVQLEGPATSQGGIPSKEFKGAVVPPNAEFVIGDTDGWVVAAGQRMLFVADGIPPQVVTLSGK